MKVLVLHGYPLGRQVTAKLNLLPQLHSTFVCVLSCAAFNFSVTDHGSNKNTELFRRLGAGCCIELGSIFVFCIFIILTDPTEQKKVPTKLFKGC